MTEEENERRMEKIVARENALRQQPHVVISCLVARGIKWLRERGPGTYNYEQDVCEKMLTALSGCLDDAERDAALASQLERAMEQKERMKQERDQAARGAEEAAARLGQNWPQPKGNEIEARVVQHTAKRLGQLLAAPEAWAGSLDTAEVLMLELVEVWLVAMGGNEERTGKVLERWRAHLRAEIGGEKGLNSIARLQSRKRSDLATIISALQDGGARSDDLLKVVEKAQAEIRQEFTALMRIFIGKELTWPAVDISKVGLDGAATYRFTEEGPWLLRG